MQWCLIKLGMCFPQIEYKNYAPFIPFSCFSLILHMYSRFCCIFKGSFSSTGVGWSLFSGGLGFEGSTADACASGVSFLVAGQWDNDQYHD